MTRAVSKYNRVYAGGWDISGKTRQVGPLAQEYDAPPSYAYADGAVGALADQPMIGIGQLVGIFDAGDGGLHQLLQSPATSRIVTVAIGGLAEPAAGVPVFSGEFEQIGYAPAVESGIIPAQIDFANYSSRAGVLDYDRPWGNLLHANAAATAANSGTADHDYGAATAFGGFGVLHILDGNGTATFTIEHADTNDDGTFDSTGAIVTFATTDADVDGGSDPAAEIKATATVTTTVQRYLRWQVALGTATTVTFVMAFHRGVR
jgi:hypothetical protein